MTTSNVPFDDPFFDLKDQEWNLISDYSDPEMYSKLDDIFRYLDEGTYRPEWAKDMTDEDLKEYYKREFPIMFANALKEYADQILKGEYKYNITFKK